MKSLTRVSLGSVLAATLACASSTETKQADNTTAVKVEQSSPTAPLLEGMGDLHWAISTESELAQRYFDQALTLAYGFNHLEAERSFL